MKNDIYDIKNELVALDNDNLSFAFLMDKQREIIEHDILNFQIQFFEVGSDDFNEMISNNLYEHDWDDFLVGMKNLNPDTKYVKEYFGFEAVKLDDIKNYLLTEVDKIIAKTEENTQTR